MRHENEILAGKSEENCDSVFSYVDGRIILKMM
jgi:hypothetical protein